MSITLVLHEKKKRQNLWEHDLNFFFLQENTRRDKAKENMGLM